MQDANRLTPAEREMEEALRQIQPLPMQMDRDRLMFEAGRRSMRRNLIAWRATAAVLVAGVGLLLFVRVQPGAPAEGRPGDLQETVSMVSREPDRAATFTGHADRNYLNLRTRLLTEGPDALTTSGSARRAPYEPDRKTADPDEDGPYLWRSQGRS